ncbi:hypothetical protein [Actinomadura vinacea]
MIRQRPRLAVEILRDVFDIDVPAHDQVTLASENVSTLHPAELNCDGAVLANKAGKAVFGVVVESQRRTDDEKEYSWPAYLATFRHQHKCDAELLVLCPDETTAQRLGKPIVLSPSRSVVYPVTVSPKALPPVTDAQEARRRPELAVLTAPAHADSPDGKDVLRGYCEALEALDRETGKLYHDYARSLFSDVARKLLEEIMLDDYQWQSDFAIKHRSEGRAEGEARALLMFLRARKICVSDETREQITGCTDLDRLELWLKRAATINTTDELFD